MNEIKNEIAKLTIEIEEMSEKEDIYTKENIHLLEELIIQLAYKIDELKDKF